MEKISGAFFNPSRNLKPINLAEKGFPSTVSESNKLYRTLWKQVYHFLIGTCNCTYNNNDPTDMLNIDTFFSLSLSLAIFYTKIGHVDFLSHAEEQVFSSNIGLLHYLNIFVPIVLSIELGSIKLLEKAVEKNQDESLRIAVITSLLILTGPLLIVSLIAQACYTLVALFIAATLVTLSSSLWYPAVLAHIKISDNVYKNQTDEEIYSAELSSHNSY